MSGSLYWKPVSRDGYCLSNRLRDVFEKSGKTKLNHEDYSYIEGLLDAGIEGAEDLLSAINEHGEIELDIRY